MKDPAKRRYDLIPVNALACLADVLTIGAAKHGPSNYLEQPDGEAMYYSAALRHLEAWRSGEWSDPDSGLPHLAHAAASVVLLLARVQSGRVLVRVDGVGCVGSGGVAIEKPRPRDPER